MKKFETPRLTIDKFHLENIVTSSGEIPAVKQDAIEAAKNAIAGSGVEIAQTIVVTL